MKLFDRLEVFKKHVSSFDDRSGIFVRLPVNRATSFWIVWVLFAYALTFLVNSNCLAETSVLQARHLQAYDLESDFPSVLKIDNGVSFDVQKSFIKWGHNIIPFISPVPAYGETVANKTADKDSGDPSHSNSESAGCEYHLSDLLFIFFLNIIIGTFASYLLVRYDYYTVTDAFNWIKEKIKNI